MKYYDLVKIRTYIKRNWNKIDRIDIGIMEDWMSTNLRIMSDGKMLVKLPTEGNKVAFREIHGSMWGTPAMRVVGKDGGVDVVKCYFEIGPRLLPNERERIVEHYRNKQNVMRLGWDGRFYEQS